jgi:hypothetical protein
LSYTRYLNHIWDKSKNEYLYLLVEGDEMRDQEKDK